ncbi:MAG: PLP-dependent aminotransferase family protein [Megasphaera sp.]
MLQLDKSISKPFYVQIYEYYRQEIESSRMVAGMRLDSVRELAQAAGISKMTVEKAYYQLASEGYILRRHKARYEVASLGRREQVPEEDRQTRVQEIVHQPVYDYDFASGDMALERFPLDIWRKYMNRVLSEPDRLLAANDDQGVPDLRRALSRYVYETRGVHAAPSQIIIGAGTISLLGILTHLLRYKYDCIGVEEPGFRLGREIFRNSGYSIVPIPIKDGLLQVDELERSNVRLVYVSPSHQFPTGTVMPAGIRHRLLQWAGETDGLIIEDDYDSELRYYGRPVPALQGLDRSGRVIYMGALSKVLPFFVRLSYMVLPPELMPLYHAQRGLFRQGASVPEQCVLAEYIQSGELSRQVRRLRKDYQEKGELLRKLLMEAFGPEIVVGQLVSGIYCHVRRTVPCQKRSCSKKPSSKAAVSYRCSLFMKHPHRKPTTSFSCHFQKFPAVSSVMPLRPCMQHGQRRKDTNGEKFAVYSMRRSSFRKPVP